MPSLKELRDMKNRRPKAYVRAVIRGEIQPIPSGTPGRPKQVCAHGMPSVGECRPCARERRKEYGQRLLKAARALYRFLGSEYAKAHGSVPEIAELFEAMDRQ